MTTQGSGNTKPSLDLKARSFQLTLNQVEKYDQLKSEFDKLKSCTYFLSAKEVAPTTGHEHIHIYAHFKTPYKLNKKILSTGVHVEICRASPKQNIEYIKKDGNIIDEIGEVPHQGQQYTVKDLAEMDTPDELDWRIHNTWQKIHSAPKKIKKTEWLKEVEVIYIWGPSGAGKSAMAQQYADDEFDLVKHTNEFWNGVVDGKGCCIYDDFRDSHMKASEFINFIDYRVQLMNIKGGCVKNNYSKIIITSIQSPEEIYRNMGSEPRQQWIRRMRIYHIGVDETPL